MDEAEQSVNSAKRDLAFTSLRAPFNALVVSRDIALGSYVQAGSAVATLYSADIAEVAIGLSPSQWAQLPSGDETQLSGDASLNWPVTLTDTTTGNTWVANIVRAEWHQSDTTRQRNAIAVIEKPLASQRLFYSAALCRQILKEELSTMSGSCRLLLSRKSKKYVSNAIYRAVGKVHAFGFV